MRAFNVRGLIRRLYRSVKHFSAEIKKNDIRKEVMGLPCVEPYPFDIEAKLLRSIDIDLGPMLDVGANNGFYSSVLEDLVGPRNLYLFEPLPDLFMYLKKNFKRATVIACALSDREGCQTIKIPYINGNRVDTRATLNKELVEDNQMGVEELRVDVKTLDSVVDSLGLEAIGFIKIDVEGHEDKVVEGATRTLSHFKPLLLVEIEARHHQCTIEEIFSKILKIGYLGYFIDFKNLKLLGLDEFDQDRDQRLEDLNLRRFNLYLNNFFFVHKSSELVFVSKAKEFLMREKQRIETETLGLF